MKNTTSVKYRAEVYCSRWIHSYGWQWKDELIEDTELTELDATDTIYILKTGDGEWSQWADVMTESVIEYESTDWDTAESDDQWTIVIYRIIEDDDGVLKREEVYTKSIWASEWASM